MSKDFFLKTTGARCSGKKKEDCINYKTKKNLGYTKNCDECYAETIKIYQPNFAAILLASVMLLTLFSLGFWVVKVIPGLVSRWGTGGINPPPNSGKTLPESPNLKLISQIQPPAAVSSLSIVANGKIVVTGDENGNIVVWDAETGLQKQNFYAHVSSVVAIAVDKDGKIIASADISGNVRIWNADKSNDLGKKPSFEFTVSGEGRDKQWVTSLAMSGDGSTLAVGGQAQAVEVWDLNAGEQKGTFPTEGGVTSLDISNNGSTVVAAAPGKVYTMDIDNYSAASPRIYSGSEWFYAKSSDSGDVTAFSSCDNNKITVVRQRGKESFLESSNEEDAICLVAVSGSGKLVAGLTFPEEGGKSQVMVWSAENNTQITSAPLSSEKNEENLKDSRSLEFSEDGRTLAASYEGEIYVWQLY